MAPIALKPLYIEDSSERNSLIKASESMPHLLLNSAAAANAVMLGAGLLHSSRWLYG
jgi:sulfate adenylyltransferase